DGEAVAARFVPLLHALELAPEAAVAEARASPLRDAAAGNAAWTVILHPASPGGAPYAALAGVADPPLPPGRSAVDFIRVSPYSLERVERVSRAVRWA